MKYDKVTMEGYEFWNLRLAHEKLAVESGDVREIALCAKIRMEHIAICVTDPSRPKRLAYESHTEHLRIASSLLQAAKEAENKIIKENRLKNA